MNQEDASLLEHKSHENRVNIKRSTSSEEWDEDTSSCSSSSCYSDSCSDDSYIANWENYVLPDGSLFYAEYMQHSLSRITGPIETALHVIRNDFSRTSTRRSVKKNKLTRFISGKNENKDDPSTASQAHSSLKADGAKVFNEHFQGEIKEIEMIINPENRFKFGRRASISEALLGFSTTPFRDGFRLMFTGYMINSNLDSDKQVKVGDWFKAINEIEVNVKNINEILIQFTKPTKVKLKFQKNCDEEQNSNNSTQQITSFEMFTSTASKILLGIDPTEKDVPGYSGEFSLMILNSDLSDNERDKNDIIFIYPKKEENELYPIRGSLLTLNCILQMEMKTDPLIVTLSINNVKWNVCFYSFEKVLLTFGISPKYGSEKEAILRLTEIIQYLKFCYETVDSILSENMKIEMQHFCDIYYVRLKKSQQIVGFETLLPECRLVSLPKEAQLRIFDALSEMEAMDYRDWNEEPLNSHREFFMFGSALFFKSYLLASLMPLSQLLGVESFMRCRGIFDFIDGQTVKDLVIWTEIPMVASTNRYFLAISSRNQLTLAVILQAFEANRRISDSGTLEEKIIGPSLFYIEEIQETLDHLRHGGIEALARVWIPSNKRPQIINISDESRDKSLSRKKTDAGSSVKNSSFSSDDVRVNSSIGGSSAPSLTHSEESNQKGDDGNSDSDWDEFPDSHKSSSGFDMSEIRGSFLKEISDVIPSRIAAGKENVLLHYIHLDIGSGMILAPPEISSGLLIDKFRSACHLIHTVLQNTKKFRRLLSQESSKPNTHKSLVAIKEHGILISLGESGNEITFWAIGRLFSSPTRELYVCHKSDTPQNLVELAFRLSFFTSG